MDSDRVSKSFFSSSTSAVQRRKDLCGEIPTLMLDVHVFGLHGKTKRESEAICKQSADRSRSAPGLRADQRATMGAMPLL